MKLQLWRARGLRIVSVTMAMLFVFSIFSMAAVNVMAAENTPPNVIRDSGNGTPTHLDFDNPPPFPEGFFPAAAGGDAKVLSEENDQIIDVIAAFVLEALASWAIGKALDYAAGDMLDSMFGENLKMKMEMIKTNNSVIIDRLEQIINMVNMLDYKEIITTKIRKMNELWNKFTVKQTVISKEMPEEERMKELQMYFDSTDSNYVIDVIDYYTTYIEGNGMLDGSVFATYDGYSLYNYYWENEGYDFRESTRALDLVYYAQMWVLAYAACQAHIDGETDDMFEAEAAQDLLLDCISMPVDGRTPTVTGIFNLLEKTPVERLAKDYYTFQVPMRRQEFYIPEQGPRPHIPESAITEMYRGWHAFDAVNDMYFFSENHTQKRHELVDYYGVLKPIEAYYHAADKPLGIRDILRNVTGDDSYIYGPSYEYGFLQKRGFHSLAASGRTEFSGFIADYTGTNNYKGMVGALTLALESQFDDNSPIRFCSVNWGLLSKKYVLRVFSATEIKPGAPQEGLPAPATVTDNGVVTEVKENSFILTLDMPDSAVPITEEVFISPSTQWGDGSAIGMESLQNLLNCSVEIVGDFSYEDGSLAAASITVKDQSGTQTVNGIVVSSVANAVMVLEDESGATNGYFLPNVQEDVPTGSRITIQYHWENGAKTVDSYELQDGPLPVPVPAPEPAPEPVDGPVPAPAPNPDPNPVDGPVNSEPLPQAA